MSTIQISAVIPVYAETDSLAAIVEALVETLGDHLFEIHIVLSATSPDTTRTVCRRLQRSHPLVSVVDQAEGPGLGHAVRTGVQRCTGSHILMIDGDGEMDVSTTKLMVQVIDEGAADLVVASRWMPGGGAVGYDRTKRVLNRAYQYIFGRLYRTPIRDLTLGYKMGLTEVFTSVELAGRFHEIACETTLRPLRAGWTVAEVPTVWTKRKAGASSNPFRRNFRYVRMALSILRSQEPVVVPR